MIRLYRTDDISQMLAIWLDASCRSHAFIPSSFWESKAGDMENIYLLAATNYVYVDELSDEVIAFLSLIDDYIAALFVKPSRQGHGIGHKLMDFVKQNHPQLSLQVYVENEKAVAFYKKQGFHIVEERKEDQTGHSEFVMQNYI